MATAATAPRSRKPRRPPSGDCRIECLDSVRHMPTMDSHAFDLVFVDPPFNIGYEYDVYEDKKSYDEYMEWCADWGLSVHRLLKPTGHFWLSIGDEYAADLKVLFCRELGFRLRSWVIWYYTFGVHCSKKFTRSHSHLFHFTVSNEFHFDPAAVKVPSARQLVYKDKRAASGGRVPDDTWILRPQWAGAEIQDGSADTWYVSRVCGTFGERVAGAPNQLPEPLLSRILLSCTRPGDRVLDPMCGSGTTCAVAKKLARPSLGFELSRSMADRAVARVESCVWGSELPD